MGIMPVNTHPEGSVINKNEVAQKLKKGYGELGSVVDGAKVVATALLKDSGGAIKAASNIISDTENTTDENFIKTIAEKLMKMNKPGAAPQNPGTNINKVS